MVDIVHRAVSIAGAAGRLGTRVVHATVNLFAFGEYNGFFDFLSPVFVTNVFVRVPRFSQGGSTTPVSQDRRAR